MESRVAFKLTFRQQTTAISSDTNSSDQSQAPSRQHQPMSRMATTSVLTLLTFLYYLQRASALTCQKTSRGEFEFFDGTTKIAPSTFPCMRATIETDSTLVVSPPTSSMAGELECPAVHDNVQKWVPKYERVHEDMKPGIMCKYECREQAGEYGCKLSPKNGLCECGEKKPRVVIRPVTSEQGVEILLGQGESTGRQSCEDREEGYEFPEAVPCISVRAEVRKRRVFKTNVMNECLFRTETRGETRFTLAALAEHESLQRCKWVCKEAAPRCTERKGNGRCDCELPGLRKVLVGLDAKE